MAGPPALFFAPGSAQITPLGASVLDNQLEIIGARGAAEIGNVIEGHADSVGPADANLRLSCRRAQAVFDYLTARGMPPDSFVLVAYGERRPVLETPDETPEPQNRFVLWIVHDYPPHDPTGRTCRT
jgi:outer membrane protein OmpA-like peptidoglycan-associated protein